MEHFGISVVIREDIGVEAESYEEAVEIVKQIWLDQHGIELADHEIDPTEPKELKEESTKKEWVTAEKFEDTVGEIKDWHISLDAALQNAKVGDIVALEHFDTEKKTCSYTNILEVLYK